MRTVVYAVVRMRVFSLEPCTVLRVFIESASSCVLVAS